MSYLPLSRRIRSSADVRLVPALALLLALAPSAAAGQASGESDLDTRIASLSSLDYQTRMNAARLIRREPPEVAVPALQAAVADHPDEFVRYRAFVVLSSFTHRDTPALVRRLLEDRNDRLREVAYKWLEARPDAAIASTLLAALQTEQNEFVRPALVGALAALGNNPQVQRALLLEANRGVDFFRSAVIDALGRHRATYALETIAAVAKLEGPLQDDAVLALGRIGGERAGVALGAIGKASPDLTLMIGAAQCLAGQSCDAPLEALVDATAAPDATVGRVRTAVSALAAAAADGKDAATEALVGLAARGGAIRDEAAVGFGVAAVRNPDHTIAWLDAAPAEVRDTAIALLKDGFAELEEDFGEEQFFAAARAAYWAAAEDSPSRTLAATLIQQLEF